MPFTFGPRVYEISATISDFVPAMTAWDPQEGRVYVAISPTFAPQEGRGEAATCIYPFFVVCWGP